MERIQNKYESDSRTKPYLPLKLIGNKNLDMKILSYYTYPELIVLEKHSLAIRELLQDPRFWAIKLKQDYDIDVLDYRRYKIVTPNKYRQLYRAQCILDILLSQDFDAELFCHKNIKDTISTIHHLIDEFKLTDLDAKYMFLLLGMDFMLDLKMDISVHDCYLEISKVPTFTDLLETLLAVWYAEATLDDDVDLLEIEEEDYVRMIRNYIFQFLEKNSLRPDILFMLLSLEYDINQDVTKKFLEQYMEKGNSLEEIEEYLEEKGYLEQFKGYLK